MIDQIRAEWRRIYSEEPVSLIPLLERCDGQMCGCLVTYLGRLRATAPVSQ